MGAIKYGPILKEMNSKLLTSLCSQVARLVLRARITVFFVGVLISPLQVPVGSKVFKSFGIMVANLEHVETYINSQPGTHPINQILISCPLSNVN